MYLMIDETMIDWSFLIRHPLVTYSPEPFYYQLWRIDDEPPSAAVRVLPVNRRVGWRKLAFINDLLSFALSFQFICSMIYAIYCLFISLTTYIFNFNPVEIYFTVFIAIIQWTLIDSSLFNIIFIKIILIIPWFNRLYRVNDALIYNKSYLFSSFKMY
jgi:hypothetical protein